MAQTTPTQGFGMSWDMQTTKYKTHQAPQPSYISGATPSTAERCSPVALRGSKSAAAGRHRKQNPPHVPGEVAGVLGPARRKKMGPMARKHGTQKHGIRTPIS